MTMSTESLPLEETAGTGIESGNGSVAQSNAALDSATDPQVATSSEEAPEAAGYDEQLRAGGDFAVEQTKNWQRKFNHAKEERETIKRQLDGVETLLPIVQQLGGAQGVIQSLLRLDKMVGDPKMSDLIRQFETTGTLSESTAEPDEYVDPVEAELRKQLTASNERITRLEGGHLRQQSTLAQQKLQGNFQKALKEFPFNAEELSEINSKVEAHIRDWSTTEQGVNALENLNEETVRTLIRGTLSADKWIDIVRRMDKTRQEGKRRLATDGGPAPTATDRATGAASNAIEACRKAMLDEGLDPQGRLVP